MGLYRLSARLDGMGEADLTRNNRLELDDVITVRSRPQPFRRLGVGAAVRSRAGGRCRSSMCSPSSAAMVAKVSTPLATGWWG